MARLAGRAVLVTGVSRRQGIGAALAKRLVVDGAAVLLHGWSPHDVEQPWGADRGGAAAIASELRAAGGAVEVVEADLAHADVPRQLVVQARATFGYLDAIVANHARSSMQSLEQLTAEEMDLSYAINTRSTLLLVRELAAQHDGRAGGRVVLFTSGQYHGAMPDELPYVASKGALHQLTPSLAAYLMPRGITVNCVDPGPNDTGYADAQVLRTVSERIPGRRWGSPTDTARLVSWLLSDEADWVTGQVIASDGGWSTVS